ncbi:MAG: BrnT family toxin [Candidatus Omnitrophica bacterium]|nr:BrnT family toxin [Candidatus Omnitrophota bacterium]
MKKIQWDPEKNRKLKEERGISFDEVLACIENENVLSIRSHPKKKYKHQKIFIIRLNEYVYYVPFVEDKDKLFLKTIIPSSKLTKEYLEKEK